MVRLVSRLWCQTELVRVARRSLRCITHRPVFGLSRLSGSHSGHLFVYRTFRVPNATRGCRCKLDACPFAQAGCLAVRIAVVHTAVHHTIRAGHLHVVYKHKPSRLQDTVQYNYIIHRSVPDPHMTLVSRSNVPCFERSTRAISWLWSEVFGAICVTSGTYVR